MQCFFGTTDINAAVNSASIDKLLQFFIALIQSHGEILATTNNNRNNLIFYQLTDNVCKRKIGVLDRCARFYCSEVINWQFPIGLRMQAVKQTAECRNWIIGVVGSSKFGNRNKGAARSFELGEGRRIRFNNGAKLICFKRIGRSIRLKINGQVGHLARILAMSGLKYNSDLSTLPSAR